MQSLQRGRIVGGYFATLVVIVLGWEELAGFSGYAGKSASVVLSLIAYETKTPPQ